MSRRVLWVDRPGVDGVVKDLGPHKLGPRHLFDGQDAIKPTGVIRQRLGWNHDGSAAFVADTGATVYRAKFVLANVVRTIAGDDDGDLFIHNPSSAGTSIFLGGVEYLARCMYGDELYLCAKDGVTPMRRYSGAAVAGTLNDALGVVTEGQAVISAIGFSTQPGVGSYVSLDHRPGVGFRILSATATSVTVEDGRVSAGYAGSTPTIATALTGITVPCVAIYDAGSTTVSAGTVTGVGTKWIDEAGVVANQDYVWRKGAGGSAYVIGAITAVPSNTSLTAQFGTITEAEPHQIMRPMCGKDAASHKGSLWMIGVKQHRTRVYVAPPGWNPSYAPGERLPASFGTFTASTDPDFFFLDFIDVPAPDDDDELVAIVPSNNPLVALGKADAWGIGGVHGSLSVDLLPDGAGAGCIDIRSAWQLSLGPVWASQHGVLAYWGGRVVNLCAGRIESEWRSIANGFQPGVDYCTIGEAEGALIVSVSSAGLSFKKAWAVYPYDESGRFNPAWFPQTNITPRFLFTSRVPGEQPAKLLGVQDDEQGRVIDYLPAVSENLGAPRDDDGTSPALKMHLPWNLPRLAGAEVEERMLEVSVEATLGDNGGAGSTLGGTVRAYERLDGVGDGLSVSLSSMDSIALNVPRVFRHKIGAKGGLHEIRLEKSITQATEYRTEVSRIGFTQRRSRRAL